MLPKRKDKTYVGKQGKKNVTLSYTLRSSSKKESSDDNHVQVETPNINDTNDTNPVDMDTPKSDTAKIVRVKAIVNSKIVMQGDATIDNIKDHNADIASVALIEHEKEDMKAKSPNKKKPSRKKIQKPSLPTRRNHQTKNGIEEEIYGDQSS